jgi:hypothetical protein
MNDMMPIQWAAQLRPFADKIVAYVTKSPLGASAGLYQQNGVNFGIIHCQEFPAKTMSGIPEYRKFAIQELCTNSETAARDNSRPVEEIIARGSMAVRFASKEELVQLKQAINSQKIVFRDLLARHSWNLAIRALLPEKSVASAQIYEKSRLA